MLTERIAVPLIRDEMRDKRKLYCRATLNKDRKTPRTTGSNKIAGSLESELEIKRVLRKASIEDRMRQRGIEGDGEEEVTFLHKDAEEARLRSSEVFLFTMALEVELMFNVQRRCGR